MLVMPTDEKCLSAARIPQETKINTGNKNSVGPSSAPVGKTKPGSESGKNKLKTEMRQRQLVLLVPQCQAFEKTVLFGVQSKIIMIIIIINNTNNNNSCFTSTLNIK